MSKKTAAEDIVCLDGTYGEPIDCNQLFSCQPLIREGSVNSMKVDYLSSITSLDVKGKRR